MQTPSEEKDYLYIKRSQIKGAGKGLFTAIDIYKDEVITYFDGEIIDDDEAFRRAEKGKDKYFVILPEGKVMDSMPVDCFAKYANDAAAYPNGEFRNNANISLDDDDLPCLTAARKIKAGEEIFCGYGKKYWKKHG
jgi:hypothetical protein